MADVLSIISLAAGFAGAAILYCFSHPLQEAGGECISTEELNAIELRNKRILKFQPIGFALIAASFLIELCTRITPYVKELMI